MNVKELRELLATFPQDLEVLYECYSDYDRLEGHEIKVGKAVDQGGYQMRPHYSMSAENKAKLQDFLIFPGN
jgi:hypothetical protein